MKATSPSANLSSLGGERAWIEGLCGVMGLSSVVAKHVAGKRLAWTLARFDGWRRAGLSREFATYRVLYGPS